MAAGTAVYCCGPELLLAAVEERCSGRSQLSLHTERFSPKEITGEQTTFDVELARSGWTLTVPENRSILEVAEHADVPVLFSRREGTCETPVLEGTPDHRDSSRTPAGTKPRTTP